jgi:soluble lytic murein transglycosylase-like protein
MIKLKVAVALAAGLVTFAAAAQERVENPKVMAQNSAKKAAAAKAQKPTKEAETCPYLFGCGSAKKAAEKADKPNAAKVQKASVSKRVSPNLVAKAQKGVKGAKKPTARKTSAKKASRPKLDKMQTASISSARVSPKLIAKARKDVKGAEKPAGKAEVSNLQYGSIVARYAESYGVPASLAHAVIRVESNYRVDALGSAGEIGLMQIKPATARMLGYSGSSKGLYNPETNIKFGIKYLSMAHKLGGGTTCGTILKYNAGHAAKRMNPVSARYCTKVKRHLAGA